MSRTERGYSTARGEANRMRPKSEPAELTFSNNKLPSSCNDDDRSSSSSPPPISSSPRRPTLASNTHTSSVDDHAQVQLPGIQQQCSMSSSSTKLVIFFRWCLGACHKTMVNAYVDYSVYPTFNLLQKEQKSGKTTQMIQLNRGTSKTTGRGVSSTTVRGRRGVHHGNMIWRFCHDNSV